jgi:hypothetical protein
VPAIVDVVERFERSTIAANTHGIRANALRFGIERFKDQLRNSIDAELVRRDHAVEAVPLSRSVAGF